MTPEEKAHLLARLDAIIEPLEHSDDPGRLEQAKQDLIDLWPQLLESMPVIGQLLAGRLGSAREELRGQSVERIKENTLPLLKQYRDFLARGAPGVGGAPSNRPNRPGCFGGTGAVLLIVALAMLIRLI